MLHLTRVSALSVIGNNSSDMSLVNIFHRFLRRQPTVREERQVHCQQHGKSNPAYVCCHSISSLRDGVERGLVYVVDEENQYNGWCKECDDFLLSNGEAWDEKTEGFAQIGFVCEGCFERLIRMNKSY